MSSEYKCSCGSETCDIGQYCLESVDMCYNSSLESTLALKYVVIPKSDYESPISLLGKECETFSTKLETVTWDTCRHVAAKYEPGDVYFMHDDYYDPYIYKSDNTELLIDGERTFPGSFFGFVD